MTVDAVRVELGARGYDILIGERLLERSGPLVAERLPGRSALVVMDQTTRNLHGRRLGDSLANAAFQTRDIAIPPGEASKTLRWASALYDELASMRADRKTVVLALGGGVVGDLAGFAAATFARGIPFVQLPTTLLAMVDASVGGKTGVDHPLGKNLIGAFHQPSLVLCDLECLNTLPPREFSAGLAEVVKYGVILDREFFEWLERQADAVADREPAALRHVVTRCCRIKADIVQRDEFETTGARALLNYGHTFAHALESATNYGRFLHGEAVAIGMDCAARLAMALGQLEPTVLDRQRRLLARFGLPTALPTDALRLDLPAHMKGDKKSAGGRPRFVLPDALGHGALTAGVDDNEVRRALVDSAAAWGKEPAGAGVASRRG